MKFKSMKRFGSIAMAGALALSLAVPAFASESTTPNQTVVDGGYVATPISVVVPTTGTAQINPYGLPVVVGATADGESISITDQQITNTPMYIANYGTVPLDVNATLAVVPKGDVEIKTSYAAATDKGKQMKVALEVAGLNDNALKQSMESEALVLDLFEKYADDATWAGLAAANKLTAPAAAKGATSVASPAKSTAALATLGAATVEGEAITYGAKSIALFRLAGEMTAEPVTGTAGNETDDPWTTEDGFTATIVFKFKPAEKIAIAEGTHVVATGGAVTDVKMPTKAYEDDTVTFTFKAAAGKAHTAAITGQVTGETAPTVTITEGTGANAGTYTGTFTMCKAQAAAGITVTITTVA